MRDQAPPFRFDLAAILHRLSALGRVDGVSLNLPFVSITVKPDNVDKRVAREIVIRMADRRVLNAFECCDDCIEKALASLGEIRRHLVDKQVDLANQADGALYLLIEVMLEAIRQFTTYEERLQRSPEYRHNYFAALEMLRAHLFRTLEQIALLADFDIPKISANMRYDTPWQLEAYVRPKLPNVG